MFTALPARTGLPRFIGPCFCLFAVGFFANSVFGAATLTVNTNVNVSRSFGNNAEETIAINPTNPRNLFCSETYHLVSKYSSDGGITWLNSNLSALPSSIGDVAAAWDDFGNLFLVRLGSSLRVSVALSTNGGASFSPLYLTPGSNNDQPSVVTGPSGVSGQGSVWICYTDPAGNFVAQGAAVTGLGTVGSFSAGQIAPGPGGDFGDIAIGPNGQVMVAYQDDNSGIGPDVLRINVDPDGLGPAGFGSVIDATTTQVGGFAPIPAQPRRTIDAEAGLAWDRSGGPHNGRVYLLYTDRNSTSSADTDIYVRFSDDNGTTWGSPVRVNDDPSGNGKSQFLPRIALDQTTGNIAVSFYDCRNSPGNNTVEVWATASIDGGLTFLPNIKVSAGVSSALVPAVSSTSFDFGDYSGLAFHAGTFYPCWADNSNSTGDNPNGTLSALDIYTAAVNLIVPPLVVAGDNSLDQLNVPVDATNAIAISAGAWHSLALRSDGKVLAWGNNDSSQCNVPLDLAGAMAIAAGGYHNLALKPDQTVAGWGADADGQASPPPGLADVLAIAAGAWHSLALRSNGTVIAWGDNSYGQTNVPPNLANVTALAAGGNHSLALKSDGSVAAWGENTDAGGIYAGQSTVPDGLAGVVAIGAGDYHSLAVTSNGTVVAWGDNSQGQASVPPDLAGAVAVAGGGSHSLALKADGTVAAWGNNLDGQCNISPAVSNVIAVAAGKSHSLLLLGNPYTLPKILRPIWQENQFQILVLTLPGKYYALEYKNSLSLTNWSSGPAVRGNGGLQFLTDPSATAPSRFYRVRQSS